MDPKKSEEEVPEYILDSLEDLSAEILDLRELMLMFAATAAELPDSLPDSGQEQLH